MFITPLEPAFGMLLLKRLDGVQGAVVRRWLDTHMLPAFARRVMHPLPECV